MYNKFLKKYKNLEKIKELFEMRLPALEQSLKEREEKGEKNGIEKGKIRTSINNAITMFKKDFSIKQVIEITEIREETAAKTNMIDVDPGKIAGNGYEQTCTLLKNSDELLEKVAPVKPEWKTKYPYVYDTPTIKAGSSKANHEFTTQAEMEGFIHNLDDAEDDMYYYSLTKTPTKNS